MRIHNTCLGLIALPLLLACNHKETPKAAPNVPPPLVIPMVTFGNTPIAFKEALGKVISGYLPIQQALAEDDFVKAKEAFMVMHGLLHTMPLEGMDSLTLSGWNDSSAAMMVVLHPMAEGDSLNSFRALFATFSDQLTGLNHAFGVMGIDSIYQMHCPMAFDQKGANWLQRGKVISNPYLGKSMPTCGNLIKILASGN